MRPHRLLVPALALAASLIAAPALAVDGEPGDAGTLAFADASPAPTPDPGTGGAPAPGADLPDASPDVDPTPGQPDEEPTPGADDGDPGPADVDPQAPADPEGADDGDPRGPAEEDVAPEDAPITPDPEEAPETAALDATVAPYLSDVTVAATEIDAAAGLVEVHGTGTPGGTITVYHWSYINDSRTVGTTVVADDGTWTVGTVDAHYGRWISVQQYVAALDAWSSTWMEIALSTDVEADFAAEVRDIDPATMTATVAGTGTPGAEVAVSAGWDSSAQTTVGPDGTFALTVSGLVWETNWAYVVHEYQGRDVTVELEFRIPHPGYAAATLGYTVVDATLGTVVLHGTGTPGAEIYVDARPDGSYGDSVGWTTVDENGRWAVGVVDTTENGRVFRAYQYLGYTLMDSVDVTVEFPAAPQPPALAPVVAGVPAASPRLAQTGAESTWPVSAAALMTALAGAAILLGRRRLTTRR